MGLVIALAATAVVALVAYRWRSVTFSWADFAATFRNVNPYWLAASIPLILSTYWGRALRWQIMVRPIKPAATMSGILAATAIGFTAVVFFGRAGELVRPYLIAKKEAVPFSSQIAAWLLERILDLMMVLLIFGFALLGVSRSGVALGPNLQTVLKIGGTIIGVAGAACLIMLLLFRYFTGRMQRRLLDAITVLPEVHRRRIERLLEAFLQGIVATRSNSYVVLLIAYSLLEWLLIVSCYLCLLWAFPVTHGFTLTDVIIFMGFVSFGAAVQIPGVGGGMQVAAVFIFTEFFRLSLEAATGMALVLWLVTFVIIVPIGVVCALREGLKWRALKHISEEASA
jgi:glycosyltransferase 2 family protein